MSVKGQNSSILVYFDCPCNSRHHKCYSSILVYVVTKHKNSDGFFYQYRTLNNKVTVEIVFVTKSSFNIFSVIIGFFGDAILSASFNVKLTHHISCFCVDFVGRYTFLRCQVMVIIFASSIVDFKLSIIIFQLRNFGQYGLLPHLFSSQ